MTLQQLQYIVALDTHRHFVRAAESCFVAQPTLTLQVKKLEEEIGVMIFDRKSQPIIPTMMGEQIIEKARQILRDVEGMKQMLSAEKETVSGNFKLGIIPTLAPYLLPLFLKTFSDSHPDVHLEVKEMQTADIIKGLNNNTLDLGILVTPLEEKSIREIVLFYEPFMVYTSSTNALSTKNIIQPEDIKNEGLWLLNQGHCFRNQVLNICNEAIDKNTHSGFSFESGSIETLKNMVRNNLGYTLIPELSVNKKIDDAFIRKFSEPQPVREVSLVVHNSFTKELLLTHLRKAILSNVPNHFKKNQRFVTVNWR